MQGTAQVGKSTPFSRRRAISWAATLAGGLTISCSSASTGAPASTTNQAAKPLPVPRTVEFWTQWGAIQLETQTKLLQRYQQANPGVTVNTATAPMVQN